ncbi:MAG: CPBP family intramembrane metalloprotease [Candidatus Methanoperedens sp.]|nr:CPBP family intramembrane metalloprotease [Candidatus Methanoperedens sp.]CAG0951446.1 hypothetical protein METP1_00213 [Methanosarcinales archaeon]
MEVDIKELIIQNLKDSENGLSPEELFNFFSLNNLIPHNVDADSEIQKIRTICNGLARDGIFIEKEQGKYIHFENSEYEPDIFRKSSKSEIRKEIFLPLFGIIIGELLMFFGYYYLGLIVHAINLQAIIITSVLRKSSSESRNVLQSLVLILLLRIINLTMPPFPSLELLRYLFIYGAMFLPVYYVLQYQNITLKAINLGSKRYFIFLLSIVIGAAMGILEFKILDPNPMIINLRFTNILLIAFVMFIFVGIVEELIFRYILLTRLEKVYGSIKSLLFSSLLFGIMHASYGIWTEVIFATYFGVVLGFIFQKTRSFPIILVIRGTANVLTFGILPLILTLS